MQCRELALTSNWAGHIDTIGRFGGHLELMDFGNLHLLPVCVLPACLLVYLLLHFLFLCWSSLRAMLLSGV